MYEKEFRVKFIACRNSFIYLCDQDSRQLDHEHMIRLSYGLSKRAYFSLGTALPSVKLGELAMDPILGAELGIIKGDVVRLSTTSYIAGVRRVRLTAASQDDYEMLEVLAETVQSTLLHQVKIVHNQQKLVIWITHALRATVDVDGIEPISPGKLEMLTEVALLPPLARRESKLNGNRQAVIPSPTLSPLKKPSVMSLYNATQYTLRLQPFDAAVVDAVYAAQPFNVFLSPRNFDCLVSPASSSSSSSGASYRNEVTLVTMRLISPPADIKELLDEARDASAAAIDVLTARVFRLPSDDDNDAIFVNATLISQYFRTKLGAKVLVSAEPRSNFMPKSIEIVTASAFANIADELVRNYLCAQCADGGRFVVNAGCTMVEPTVGCRFRLKFVPANERFLLLDAHVMRACRFKLAEVELVEASAGNGGSDGGGAGDKPVDLCLDAGNYRALVDGVRECLLRSNASAILTGKTGSGKTTLLKKIAEDLGAAPRYVHVEQLSCRRLKGKNIESLLKALNIVFLRLIYYQPSLLVLDDLHVICEKVVEGDQPTQENLHFNKVSEMLAGELEHLLAHNRIALLATTESLAKLNRNIYDSRGKHLFKNCYVINEMNQDDRIKVLQYLFDKKEVNFTNVEFKQLGHKTEGFIFQDLLDLVDKIIFEAYKDSSDVKNITLQMAHCEKALANASTLSLRQVQLHATGDRDFDDVGGLDDVKKTLVETMLWPAQYANIFARAPLRLQSGVLLYGPPGTGKTILAGAAARQCNLRLIAVKGPELLSKYIGASEQAVRDVFEKAQSAKPCILFFDEFDSLAPRRGHDNTGVTDRVVNQFLTQLDGVESLSGVCVLAATSRPDLLDPALLRPGRLDRQILCPMPDKQSRLAILKTLSKHLHMAADVQLERVADATEGFSGADLQAILYTAQLNSVEHLLSGDNKMKKTQEVQVITWQHVDAALKSTRPSLTKEERAKYDRIYDKFHGKGDILESLLSGKQKATLA